MATIEYLLEKTASRVKWGDLDPVAVHYQGLGIEKHFRKGNLPRLQKILGEATEGLRGAGDLEYSGYIKEKTGYDIDLFEGLPESIDKILQQKKIRNRNEYGDARAMHSIYRQTAGKEEHIDRLAHLLTDFEARLAGQQSAGKRGYILNEVSGSYSPDKSRKVTVTESGTDPNHLVTQVFVHFRGAGGSVYSAPGSNLGIRVYWKDNSTLVIETAKDLPASTRHEQVQSFDDIVMVEYLER